MNQKRIAPPLRARASVGLKGGLEENPPTQYDSSIPRDIRQNGHRITVRSDNGKRVIGEIVNHVFRKSNFHSTRHMCWKHNAIGIDKWAFSNHILPEAVSIEVYDHDKRVTYSISISDFQSRCTEDDLSWGPQWFVPLKYWTQEQESSRQLPLWGHRINEEGSYGSG